MVTILFTLFLYPNALKTIESYTAALWFATVIYKISAELKEYPDLSHLKDMSSELFVTFTNDTKLQYKPSSVREIMSSTRKQLGLQYLLRIHVYDSSVQIKLCYAVIITYRQAMVDLLRYYQIRFLYVDTLEYEVGFLTHEIIYRYQLILELYQIVERMYAQRDKSEKFAPVSYMFHMYTNILQHSKAIIHLCNMLHEVEAKYKGNKKGVFVEYDTERKGESMHLNKTPVDKAKLAYQKYIRQQRREQKRLEKERKKYMKKFSRFGTTRARRKTTPKRGPWPIIYGWSIEDW